MVDQISRIYGPQQIQPVRKSERSEKTEKPSTDSSSGAARLIPDLHDTVVISEAGRAAAANLAPSGDVSVPHETTEAIRSNWYSVGYMMLASSKEM